MGKGKTCLFIFVFLISFTWLIGVSECKDEIPLVVTIEEPKDFVEFYCGDEVTFTGKAIDLKKGKLPGKLYYWRSSQDKFIGQGVTFKTNKLSIGQHLILLEIKDAKRRDSNKASVYVTIKKRPEIKSDNETAKAAEKGEGGLTEKALEKEIPSSVTVSEPKVKITGKEVRDLTAAIEEIKKKIEQEALKRDEKKVKKKSTPVAAKKEKKPDQGTSYKDLAEEVKIKKIIDNLLNKEK